MFPPVQWRTQLGYKLPGTNVKAVNWCGQANVAGFDGRFGRTLSALDVAIETGTADQTLSNFQELINMFRKFKVDVGWSDYSNKADLAWHKRVIDEGGRAVVLVAHRYLDPAWPWAHLITTVDYDDRYFWIMNPLWDSGPLPVPIPGFERAINERSEYIGGSNNPRQALRVPGVYMSSTPQLLNGINIDPKNPIAKPPGSALRGMGYARFACLAPVGSIDSANAFYAPYIDDLADNGVKPIVVFNHQTGLEKFNWSQMYPNPADTRWDEFIKEYVQIVTGMAQRYGEKIVYQIHNEQDYPSEAAVGIPPSRYGELYRKARAAIKAVAPNAVVITGGYVTGPGEGIRQFKEANITQCDGIGIHTYQANAAGYGSSPSFASQFAAWGALGFDLFCSEYGQPGNYNATDSALASYATAALQAGKANPRVKAVVWFSYATGQHDGMGYVNPDRPLLKTALFTPHIVSGGTPQPQPDIQTIPLVIEGLTDKLNMRVGPSTSHSLVSVNGRTYLWNGDKILPTGRALNDGRYLWREYAAGTVTAWSAWNAAGVIRLR